MSKSACSFRISKYNCQHLPLLNLCKFDINRCPLLHSEPWHPSGVEPFVTLSIVQGPTNKKDISDSVQGCIYDIPNSVQ